MKPWCYPSRNVSLVLILIKFWLVPELTDNSTDLIGEESVHPSQYNKGKFGCLLNLKTNDNTAEYNPETPIMVGHNILSTETSQYTESTGSTVKANTSLWDF